MLRKIPPINFVLCTHVLPDGIGDLVHLKDFSDYLAISNTNINRVDFVLDSDMNKAASILEITLIIFYYKFLCSVSFFRLLLLLNRVLLQKYKFFKKLNLLQFLSINVKRLLNKFLFRLTANHSSIKLHFLKFQSLQRVSSNSNNKP